MKDLEKRFHSDMLSIYKRANEELGYRATRFLQMLSQDGGVATACVLVSKAGGTDGFATLWEFKRLDLSVEALVIKEEYKTIFSEDIRKICMERLKEYGYVPNNPNDTNILKEEPDAKLTDDMVFMNKEWSKLSLYSNVTVVLIKELARQLMKTGISFVPKFRGDKAIAFALATDKSKNILTIWAQSERIKIKILGEINAYCSCDEDFEKYNIIKLARKKFDEIR